MIYLQEYVPPKRQERGIPPKKGKHLPLAETAKSVAILLGIVILLQGVVTINQYDRMMEWGKAWGDAWMQAAQQK